MFINEVTLLSSLDHPNILKLFEYFEDNNAFYIITSINKGGSLRDRIT